MWKWFEKGKNQNYKSEIDTLETIYNNKVTNLEKAIWKFKSNPILHLIFKYQKKNHHHHLLKLFDELDKIKNKVTLLYIAQLNEIKKK